MLYPLDHHTSPKLGMYDGRGDIAFLLTSDTLPEGFFNDIP